MLLDGDVGRIHEHRLQVGGLARGILHEEHFKHLRAAAFGERFTFPQPGANPGIAVFGFCFLGPSAGRLHAAGPVPRTITRGRGEGGAGRSGATSTEKLYWKIFWEQPEVAAAIVTVTRGPRRHPGKPLIKQRSAIVKAKLKDVGFVIGFPELEPAGRGLDSQRPLYQINDAKTPCIGSKVEKFVTRQDQRVLPQRPDRPISANSTDSYKRKLCGHN